MARGFDGGKNSRAQHDYRAYDDPLGWHMNQVRGINQPADEDGNSDSVNSKIDIESPWRVVRRFPDAACRRGVAACDLNLFGPLSLAAPA